MQSGKLLINGDDFYCGNSSNSLKQLALKSDIPDTTSIPAGIITMWSGLSSDIPSGWLLCNGSNGTPDLRDRFIVGAGNLYEVGNSGGSNTVILTTEQLPNHSHENNFEINLSGLTCASAGGHSHTVQGVSSRSGGGNVYNASTAVVSGSVTTSSSGSHTHSISGSASLSGSISNTGGSQAHENRPPYYALCFIMKS